MATFSEEAGLAVLPNADALLVEAAKGDRVAQGMLLDHAIACADYGMTSPEVGLGAAEVFARMAASHGLVDDRRRLSAVLLLCASREAMAGNREGDRDYQIEALTLMNQLADEGDEMTADNLIKNGGAFPPDILQLVAAAARVGATVH